MLVFIPFGRQELRHPDPFIDLRVLRQPTMWPVIVTAGLFGISVLGAQIPLSTYASTPRELGYGLGLESDVISYLIGVYLVSMIIGAVLFPILSRRATPRIALIVAAFFVATGYLLFIPFHLEVWQVVMNMVIAGIGSGALVAALPAAAAAAAPKGQTGVATGLTNTTKTIGGSFASAVFGVVLATGAVAGVGSRRQLRRLHHDLGHLRGHGAGLRGPAVLRAEAGVRRRRGRAAASPSPTHPTREGARARASSVPSACSGSRITLCAAACATGRTVTRSRLMWPGSSTACTIASAMSSATSGSTTPGVDGVGLRLVAAEPRDREPLRLHHARRHLEHPDRLPRELEPQHPHERVLGELRGVVARRRSRRPRAPRPR